MTDGEIEELIESLRETLAIPESGPDEDDDRIFQTAYRALRHLHDEVKALRARQAELEGRKPDGYAAQCEDGSLCYEYFTEHREGIEHALKVDGWEGMEPVPVCIMRSSKEDK